MCVHIEDAEMQVLFPSNKIRDCCESGDAVFVDLLGPKVECLHFAWFHSFCASSQTCEFFLSFLLALFSQCAFTSIPLCRSE